MVALTCYISAVVIPGLRAGTRWAVLRAGTRWAVLRGSLCVYLAAKLQVCSNKLA